MTRSRPWLWLAALAMLLALAACSDDDENRPPSAEIAYPEPGFQYTSAPDSVVIDARDDSGVTRVDVFLDGLRISTVRSAPFSTRLPLGEYADGEVHYLDATAYDARGLTGDAGAIPITIHPSLQTIPQVAHFGPASEADQDVVLRWLQFPLAVTRYEWQIAADDAFALITAAGDTGDTTATVPVPASGLAYARVRAVMPERTTGWSRTARYSGLPTTRTSYPLPQDQLVTRIVTAPDGTLRLLSHAVDRHRVATAPVQLLELDASLELVTATTLLEADREVTASVLAPAGDLVLAGRRADGVGTLTRVSLDGQIVAAAGASAIDPTALAVAGGEVLAFGGDRRPDAFGPGGLIARVEADALVTPLTTFPLESGRDVQHAWEHPDGGWVVAGQLPPVIPDEDDGDAYPGGLWARGLDAGGQERWAVRLGTADRWLLRGGAASEAGHYLLTGIAFTEDFFARYGFAACIDARGRILWTVTDRGWHLLAGAAPDLAGRWTVVGAERRRVGDNVWEYDFGLRGFSAAGAPLWEASHRAGRESQGWTLAPHPDGGWWAGGMRTEGGAGYDADLLRTDDRGALAD